jgi:protein-tyrosine phosphatase
VSQEHYWIDGPWAGKLAILPRPRGGDWLEDEIKAWKQSQFDVIVSLLTLSEMQELDIEAEQHIVEQQGLKFISLPIPDRSIPFSFAATRHLVETLFELVMQGKIIGVHCRQGIGRSSLLAASMLVLSGIPADEAFDRVAASRGRPVPDTDEQRRWVARLAQWIELSRV